MTTVAKKRHIRNTVGFGLSLSLIGLVISLMQIASCPPKNENPKPSPHDEEAMIRKREQVMALAKDDPRNRYVQELFPSFSRPALIGLVLLTGLAVFILIDVFRHVFF